MTESNAFTLLMLPPQTALTRQWAQRLSDTVSGMRLIAAEDAAEAAVAITTADAAFGTLPPGVDIAALVARAWPD